MKYPLRHAFFCEGITTDTDAETTTHIIRTIPQSAGTTRIQVLVAIAGPPAASDSATIGILMPDGKATHVGPEEFSFNAQGRATLVFQLHTMPLQAAGVVSAQILFFGERQATPVCELRIVPPSTTASGWPTIH